MKTMMNNKLDGEYRELIILLTKLTLLILCTALITTSSESQGREETILKKTKNILLPAVKGRIDHMDIDLQRNRLFLSALGNSTVEVIDIEKNKSVHSIGELKEPQGVKYLPSVRQIAVACGGDGALKFYDDTLYRLQENIELGDDADNVRYDAEKNLLFVGYGNGGIAIVDVMSRQKFGDIQLPAHPESFQVDMASSTAFVNVPGADAITVLDISKKTVKSTIPLEQAKSNFPMAFDAKNHRLFVGCRNPAQLLVFNTDSNSVITSLPINGDCDDVFWNDKTKNIYISCGEGFLDVIDQVNPNRYTLKSKIKTASGARTALFVPQLQQLFLAVPHRGNQSAAVWIYEVKP